MKWILILSLLMATGCTSKTEFGDCIGLFDDKDSAKVYKLSKANLFWGFVGSSFILPPIFVVVDQTFCPVGNKK